MSDGKTILVDVSRCTGCRGCQVACKQWNELPATDTVQTGSYQNPPDMNGDTYKIVRFREGRHENGKPYWNFFTDMCRHCVNPPCVQSCPTGAMRFGERAAMLELAHKRVEELKKEFPKAHAVDPDDVRVIYVITDDPDKYAEHVGA